MKRVFCQIATAAGLTDSATAVCDSQSTNGAGNLLINGSATNQAGYPVNTAVIKASQQIVITNGGGSLTTVTFTIWGTNVNGGYFKEDILGPGAASTVTTLNYFKTISKISVSAAVSDVSVGALAVKGAGVIVPMNYKSPAFNTSYTTVIGGTASVEIDITANDPQKSSETLNWIKLMGPLSASTITQSITPVYAVKCFTTAYTSGAIEFIVLQSGYALGG